MHLIFNLFLYLKLASAENPKYSVLYKILKDILLKGKLQIISLKIKEFSIIIKNPTLARCDEGKTERFSYDEFV